jgi:hypothetical protein
MKYRQPAGQRASRMRFYRRNLKNVLAKNPHMAEAYAVGARTAAKAQRRWSGLIMAAVSFGAIVGLIVARFVLWVAR